MKIFYTPQKHVLSLLIILFLSGISNTLLAQPELTFTPFIQGLDLPVNLKSANDSSGRLFIVEQTGRVKIYKDGVVQAKPFLDLSTVVATGEYKGLWSVAFPNDFNKTKMFFVYYYDKLNNTILARYQVSKQNPDSVILSTRVELLSLQDTVTNGPHMGEMHFGRDNYLYITINDGSYIYKTTKFSQDSTSLFGKMLRLNVKSSVPPYYTIPRDNPFTNSTTVRPEIWFMGFRNAWRFSFDRTTLNMWINDDGGEQWDEINVISRKQQGFKNFGWPCYEGAVPFISTNCGDSLSYTFPIYVTPPDANGEQAIIGGFVYRGKDFPKLKGYYICSDYIQNKAWKIRSAAGGTWNIFEQINIPAAITSYAEDDKGELYATSAEGIIYRVGAVNP